MSPGISSLTIYDTDSDDSDTSLASFPPLSPSICSSDTSNWERSNSPVPSILSMTSSLREAAFRQEYGRYLNNYSEVYRFPADQEELERLDKQHVMIMGIMGKYPPPFADVLADEGPGEQKAVLDLGCGSGAWITDVAREFPHCSAVAVDLIPMQDGEMPPNCRSEVDDINFGLEHFYGDFNVVHARLVQTGIKDYARLIDQISRVLRPGGLMELMEFDLSTYTFDRKLYDVDLTRIEEPYIPRWSAFMKTAVRKRGGDVDAANYLHSWVHEHGAFQDIVHREFWIPLCPWAKGDDPESKWWNKVGEIFRANVISFVIAARPLLLGSGLEEHFIDELQEKAIEELMQNRYTGLLRAEAVYAIKRPIQSPS